MATEKEPRNHGTPAKDSSTEPPALQTVVAHASEEVIKHRAPFRGIRTKDS